MNKEKPNLKELVKLAKNSESIRDQFVYRGFIDEDYDPDIEYDYSEQTLVMITPLGEFVGSSTDGKPTKEIIDEESIIQMARQTEELLLDRDHASMRSQDERNTKAYGWISGLKAIVGLGDMDGLYGTIKWTPDGIELVKERAYRFLSPVFELDGDGRAIKLVNVALTNRPALPLPPIINSESKDGKNISITNSKKDTDLMNKDEIENMIRDMVKQAISENNKAQENTEVVNSECKVDETKKETTNEESKVDETNVDETNVEETKVEENKEETTNEESKVDETKVDETKEEKKVEETKEENKEVIKADVLNSAVIQTTLGTSINGMDKWRSLKGQEFFKYLREHPEIR